MVTPAKGRRYRIVGTIGKGGFGTVYKAEMLGEGDFSKTVALKVLNPDAALVNEVAQRLRDEARILGLVRHRGIVQVDGLVRLDDRWTIVMEYVEGVDLREAVSDGPMPTGAVLEVIQEISSALHQAWIQAGPDGQPLHLLHRDIKPSNVVLTAAGEVKVLDFGTARANFGAREAKTESIAFGTLDFMSPERMEFHDLPAGDIYAVGCLMFELLTGGPVGRTSPDPVKHQVVFDRARQVLTSEGVDPEVADLVMACLECDPELRPTADTMARSCRELRSRGQNAWLADWARVAVPPKILARGDLRTDEMTGAVLIESSGSRLLNSVPEEPQGTTWVQRTPVSGGRQGAPNRPDTPVPAPPTSGPISGPTSAPIPVQYVAVEPRSGAPWWLVPTILVGAFGIGFVLLGLGFFYLVNYLPFDLQPKGTEVAEERTDRDIDAAASVEAKAKAKAKAEAEAEEEKEAKEPKPTAKPTPRPRPTTPTSRPAPAMAKVAVVGDAQKVEFLGKDGKRRPAGRLPPGTYTIEATFEGFGTVKAGTVTVGQNDRARVTCQKAFGRCQVSKY